VDDILGAEDAKQIVKDALNMYQEHYVPKKLRTTWA
jgi:inorganic pyrophosphatase